MATDKLFNVIGVSKLNGEYKVRFATDIMRIKVLAKHGHEDIRLAELDKAVTKYEGVKQIQAMDEFQDAAAQSAIAEYLEDKAPKAPKAKATTAKATKAAPKKATKASREAEALAQARAVAKAEAETENEPF
jgi:anti-sigma factor RsiW